jgi:hypothetical protein
VLDVQKYNWELKDILDNTRDDAAPVSEIGESDVTEMDVVESDRDEDGKRKRPTGTLLR